VDERERSRSPKSGYARSPLSNLNAPDEKRIGLTMAAPTSDLESPHRFSLCWMVTRWSSRRIGCRWFQLLAVALGLSESLIYLLGESVGKSEHALAHILGSTLFLTMWLTLFAGFFLVQGFVDPPTSRFLDEVLKRHGQHAPIRQTLETRATTLWIGMLTGLPLFITTTLVLVRTRSSAEFAHIVKTSGLMLGVAELFAMLVFWALRRVKESKLPHPRMLVLLILVGPEILRAIDPSLPTLSSIIGDTESLVLRWSEWP
jgi:hypothetical protein